MRARGIELVEGLQSLMVWATAHGGIRLVDGGGDVYNDMVREEAAGDARPSPYSVSSVAPAEVMCECECECEFYVDAEALARSPWPSWSSRWEATMYHDPQPSGPTQGG